MGAGRFWAPRERRQTRSSFQQVRDRIRLPKDLRWSEPTKNQQPISACSSDRDRVAEAREWIESQCATAGFGDLDLGRPPSPLLSSRKSSISLAPSVMTQSTAASVQEPNVPTSPEDLQTRIDVLSDKIAERERRIRTRQQLERLQAEEDRNSVRAPSIEVIPEKREQEQVGGTGVELDSRSATNLAILEEVDDKDELPAYSNPNCVSIVDYKIYRPPPPHHPAFSTYQLVEPGQTESLDRSRSDSFTPKPYLQSHQEQSRTPTVLLDPGTRASPPESNNLRPPYRPIMHQRTLSAPGDRPTQPTPDFQNAVRGRSVSIDTRNLTPTAQSSTSSTATTWDISTAATTPAEDINPNFLSASSSRSPLLPPKSAPTTPIVYCSDPIALSPTEHPSENPSMFSDLENLAGAFRIKPRSSMSNLQRNISHASQAPIPVSSTTTKSQRYNYLEGQAPMPAIPALTPQPR